MNSYANTDTLIGTALAPLDWTRSVGIVIVFSLFIAACAQFAVPIGDVPITGQKVIEPDARVVDGRAPWVAFGRGGRDCVFD